MLPFDRIHHRLQSAPALELISAPIDIQSASAAAAAGENEALLAMRAHVAIGMGGLTSKQLLFSVGGGPYALIPKASSLIS